MTRVVGIVSGKGGVGKTTIAANLGIALHGLGQDVLLIDGDMTNANLGFLLGFYQFPAGIQEAMEEGMEPVDVVYTHQSGVNFIPGSLSMDYVGRSFSYSKLRRFLEGIESLALLDSPPGLGKDAVSVMRSCDELVVVTNPELPSVVDSLKLITCARNAGQKVAGVVLNRVKGRYEISEKEIQNILKTPVIGRIPEDKAITRSAFYRTPVVIHEPLSPSAVAITELASKLAGVDYKKPAALWLRRMLKKI